MLQAGRGQRVPSGTEETEHCQAPEPRTHTTSPGSALAGAPSPRPPACSQRSGVLVVERTAPPPLTSVPALEVLGVDPLGMNPGQYLGRGLLTERGDEASSAYRSDGHRETPSDSTVITRIHRSTCEARVPHEVLGISTTDTVPGLRSSRSGDTTDQQSYPVCGLPREPCAPVVQTGKGAANSSLRSGNSDCRKW